ncbi:type I secretion system permease/ATPase [Endozoicomonadaceae bacterium StTr2]
MSLFEYAGDPLAGCLKQLVLYFDCRADQGSLTAGLPLRDGCLMPREFQRAAERAGLETELAENRISSLKEDALPAVLLMQNDQACVLFQISRSNNEAVIADPEGEYHTIRLSDLEQVLTGFIITVRPHLSSGLLNKGTQEEDTELKRSRWFWSAFKPYVPIYRDVLLASLLVNMFALASPLFVMNVYDRVVPNQAFETLWMLAIGVLLAYTLEFAVKAVRARFVDLVGKQIDLTLSARLMEKVLGLKLAARPAATGSFMSNLAEFDSIRSFITSATVLTLVDLPFVLLFMALVIWVGGPLVAVPLASMTLAGIAAWFINRPLQQNIEQSQQVSSERQAFLVETLMGLEAIKTSQAESQSQFHWERMNRFLASVGLKIRQLQFVSSQLATFMMQVGTILLIAGGVYMISAGDLSMGGLIALMMVSGRCTAPVIQAIGLINQYERAKQALDHAGSIMSLPQERPVERRFLKPGKVFGSWNINNVTFAYPDSQPLLKEVSIEVKAGEKVAVLGRMGSGKSTLLQLLMDLWEASDGTISLDGIDIRQLDPAILRSYVGYVPQHIDLFRGSIRDNITLGRSSASDEDIIRAVKQSGFGELLESGGAGLDYQVAEGGRNLSGGQIQSIGIARALLLNPPVLILDEPTSAMDNQGEACFRETLASLKEQTVIMVTHKISLLDCMDTVVVMEKGRVVAKVAAQEMLASQRVKRQSRVVQANPAQAEAVHD